MKNTPDRAPTPADAGFMATALGLARRGLGAVAPNPAVGCVLVCEDPGVVVGRGWTQPGGRPHAETEALRRAGNAARGAVAYVTLEPCDHHGETPPCSEALIDAGIAAAVIAVEDPDPRVSGSGVARLRDAGIPVTTGVGADEAWDLNAGFFLTVSQGRPLFTLKAATTLDGRIATRGGDSQWITGPEARAFAHRLRAEHDAVLVGIGTALADDPDLTCRLPGMAGRSPIRIVLDGRLRLPVDSRLVTTARETPTWLVTVPGNDPAVVDAFRSHGVEVLETEADDGGRPDLAAAARALAARGLTRVLVEGGGQVAGSVLAAGLADRVAWFRAPRLIGGDGVAAAAVFGVETLADAPGFVRTGLAMLGADTLETYRREE